MSGSAVVTWAIVILWLFTTLAFQHTAVSKKLANFWFSRFLPRWTFFAPNPGVRDYHLVFRDRSQGGNVGNWRPADFGRDRHFTNIIWNPHKRPKKILNDAVQSLRMISAENKSTMSDSLSLPYLLLLNYVFSQCPVSDPSDERQFAIFESTGHGERELSVAYMSLFHSEK